MASTHSDQLRLELQATGENSGNWGSKTNTNLELLEEALSGLLSINAAGSSNITLTTSNAASDQARHGMLKFTGTLTGNIDIIVPAKTKAYLIWNATSGSFTLSVKTSGGTGKTITQGTRQFVFCDGTNVEEPDYTAGAIGTDIQAWDAQLDDIAALSLTNGNFIVADGSNWVAESGSTVAQSIGGVTQDLDTLGVPASDGQVVVATGSGAFAYEKDATLRATIGIANHDSIVISSNGEAVNSEQPAFLAQAASQSSVTGDGTLYTIQFTTEIYDQNSDFDGTSTFTAPVTGIYHFALNLQLSGLTTSETQLEVIFVSSNRSITVIGLNPANSLSGGNTYFANVGLDMDMDAADTFTVTITVSNGTKDTDINTHTHLSGRLVT